MTTAVSTPRLTPDDLLRLEDEGLFELVDGRLVEKQNSYLATLTAGLLPDFAVPVSEILPPLEDADRGPAQ